MLARRRRMREAALGQISALADEGDLPLAIATNARMAGQFKGRCCRAGPLQAAGGLLPREPGRRSRAAGSRVPAALHEGRCRGPSEAGRNPDPQAAAPAQAMRVLSKLPRTGLSTKEEAFRRGLQEAAAAIKGGPMELATEDW